MPESKRIGDILVERGVIDDATADLIEAERLLTRSRFLSAAVAHGRVSEVDALAALAVRDGVPAIDLGRAILATRIAKRVPLAVARQHLLLPVREDGPYLLVAMATPTDRKVIDELSFASGLQILPYAALYSRLSEIIPQVHATTGPYYRGPLAPPEIGDQEHVPIVTADQLSPGVDVEVVIDSDFDAIDPDGSGSPPTGAISAESDSQPAVEGEKLVLVVEDEPDISRLVVATIRQLGCTVITASRGLEALRLIKERHPSLIILDAMLPEVHGFEICRKVKESKRFGATPVLMISAIYRGWQIAEDIKATYKADAFLEKPFRVADLRHVGEQLLVNAGSGDQNQQLGADAERLAQLAQEALSVGETDRALEQLHQVESLEPFSPTIQFLIATALEQRGSHFQAIYHYERAIELKPDYFAAAEKAANLYQTRGFTHKAIEMWARALRAAPSASERAKIKQHLVKLL